MIKNTIIYAFCLAGISLAAAGTTTVVLQNGLNGYDGCTDSYLEYHLYNPQGNLDYLYFSCG